MSRFETFTVSEAFSAADSDVLEAQGHVGKFYISRRVSHGSGCAETDLLTQAAV